jgi:hypothetical protein
VSIGLFAQSGGKNGYQPEMEAMKPNWAAGVKITAPQFNGFSERYHLLEATKSLDAAEAGIMVLWLYAGGTPRTA